LAAALPPFTSRARVIGGRASGSSGDAASSSPDSSAGMSTVIRGAPSGFAWLCSSGASGAGAGELAEGVAPADRGPAWTVPAPHTRTAAAAAAIHMTPRRASLRLPIVMMRDYPMMRASTTGSSSGRAVRQARPWAIPKTPAIALLLVLATLSVYAPVLGYGFISYDDPDYVTSNPQVQAGLTLGGIAWA